MQTNLQISWRMRITLSVPPGYDFSVIKAAFFLDENKQWFLDLKNLVEVTYEANENVPVTFIVHSMGAPMTLVFLQQQEKTWKSKYISRVISLAGAWAGSVKALKVFAIGL